MFKRTDCGAMTGLDFFTFALVLALAATGFAHKAALASGGSPSTLQVILVAAIIGLATLRVSKKLLPKSKDWTVKFEQCEEWLPCAK